MATLFRDEDPLAVRARDRRVCFGIFLAAFFFYMLTSSRERPWADATPVWEVAENIVTHGSVAVDTRWPYDARKGRNGRYYAANPLINSLVHVPGAALRHAVGRKWPGTLERSWPLCCHLAPAALGALACVLFFALCRDHGVSRGIASLATIAVGAGSIVWVYARYPYSEILQTAFFTGAFLQLVRVLRDPSGRNARWLGLWAALLLSAKTVYAVSLPGAACVLAWQLRHDRRALGRVFAWIAVMLVPAALAYLGYNWARYGSPLDSGYGNVGAVLQSSMLTGLWGLFLSPGKSLFLYSPPVFLALFGLGTLVRRHRATAILMAATVLPVLLVCARLPFWHGDYAWGPRYAVFATPVLALPLCFVLQRVGELAPRWWRLVSATAVAGVLALGIFFGLLGSAFHWDHWIRITMEARTMWLGAPNRSGSVPPDRGGICDACFEDLHQLHWLPDFQPIRGHYWLLRHVVRGDNWIQAEADAPWHPDTRLRVVIAGSYQRARIDWWPLDYEKEKWGAAILFVVAGLGLATGIVLWARTARTVPLRPVRG